ncbi:hypothetical protein HETIRDRAFT_41809 [Heterobasidion irregulare TC 32-1]|uniref:Thioredoxin domain-containing protein n=1 Tax=Heterobasidion irregulare (strain TC 32-1) TaxID=747525 RepID=W4KMS2_HETIT|nr:uncharacterized protein HETIRDRAFT_41809 [Heterobasidion irregulare TC 32-1]ETW87117.1 hypothetical protein HETIRDRAFT_41809 [Heterobasidion irregulare TC 32-1]
MPLYTASSPLEFSSWKDVQEKFVIFYASRDREGKMWCPDCRDVEDTVERTFAGADAPPALIIYVGQKPEWKAASNHFRDAPWYIEAIPTIVRVKDATEDARLVEGDIVSQLASFVK